MKKAYKVNVSGAIFNIDADAYDGLKKYLDSLEQYYADDPDGKDIVADIENRIAELFQDRLTIYKQAISKDDIQEVLAIMGNPDEINNPNEAPYSAKATKNVYRNPDDRILGGVCGGLGSYFNVQSNWIRLAFVLAFIFAGTGALLYIILWALIPVARTSSELLEMRGESINIQNIEKSIRKEYENVKYHWKERNRRV
jgi:phage shock protein PspC (stress-responsive transcriptional regulator)